MAEFIELTQYRVGKIIVSIDHIVKVKAEDGGSMVYFDIPSGNGNSLGIHCVHVTESYAILKRKLII